MSIRLRPSGIKDLVADNAQRRANHVGAARAAPGASDGTWWPPGNPTLGGADNRSTSEFPGHRKPNRTGRTTRLASPGRYGYTPLLQA